MPRCKGDRHAGSTHKRSLLIISSRSPKPSRKRDGMEKMLSGCDTDTARVFFKHRLSCLVMA